MGLRDKQRAKADNRLQAVAQSRLRSGEEIEEAFTAVSRLPWLILSLPPLPVVFELELRGASAASPWVIGAYVGLVTMSFLRSHHVVLTNHWLLVLKLRWMSSGNVSEEHSLPRDPSVKVLNERSLLHVVRIEYGSRRWRLIPLSFYRERVANLIRRAEAWT